MRNATHKRVVTVLLLLLLLSVVSGMWICRYARQELCYANMASMVSCLHVYMNDYDGRFPTSYKWCDLLKEEALTPASNFKCPGADQGPCTYALNKNAVSVYTYYTAPADMVLMFEATPGWNQSGGRDLLTTEYHNDRGCHIMFANLTVAFVKKEDIESLRWE